MGIPIARALAALSAACLYVSCPARADDPCTISGATLTCTGDQSDGINTSNPPYDTVNVNSLTQAITPVPAISGVWVQSSGGAVTINVDTGPYGITTTGNSSMGIFLQSSHSDYNWLAVSSSGDASVLSTGAITTDGFNADGIYVSGTSYASGGTGAHASTGMIDVTSSSDISTLGDGARGIRAASSSTGIISGGITTATGGDVRVSSTGAVSTQGFSAYGIDATSDATANGFGDSTQATSGNVEVMAGPVGTSGDISYGIFARSTVSSGFIGSGSANISSGDVTVIASGLVSTQGRDALGISTFNSSQAYVQGLDAISSNGALEVESQDIHTLGDNAHGIYAANSALAQVYGASGPGSSEAHSGEVTVNAHGTITTEGSGATGITAEGSARAYTGSSGVDATATGGLIDVTSAGIGTLLDFSYAINVRTNAFAETEGTGASSATGGDIIIDAAGPITTAGSLAGRGIFVISDTNANTRNGTGLGAMATGSDITVTSGDIETIGTGSHGINAASFALSQTQGTGDAVSSGGTLTLTNNGELALHGYNSIGIFAQTNIQSVTYSTGSTLSNGGTISVTNAGSITVDGEDSQGISVYDSAYSFTSIVGLNSSAQGSNVTVNSADIQVNGQNSTGIAVVGVAQAYSGTGTATAHTGNVEINSTGTLSASNSGSIGIYAESTVHAANSAISNDAIAGDIAVNVLSGSVTGGAAGIVIRGGKDNVISNAGTISAVSGLAVIGDSGAEAIENAGILVGDVDLGGGSNAFNNNVGGTYRSGAFADLGNGNTLTNRGDMTPGGSGAIQTTVITGNFVQASSGTYTVDADWTTATADVLAVSGTAQLAGTVVVVPASFPTTAGLTRQFLILQATGGATDNGITTTDTAAVDYDVVFDSNGLDVYLNAIINFTGVGTGGLNPNQTAIGENINAIQVAGSSPGFTPVANALMSLPTQAALANALDQLSPEIYNYAKIETLFAAEQFSSDMMSCRVADGSGASFIREGQCIWARARARFLDLDTTGNNIGADATVGSFSGGAQFALAKDWRLGLAAGYDNISIDTGTGASANGDRANIGGVIKYNPGPLLLAAGITGGWNAIDSTRTMAFGGFAGMADGDSDIGHVSGRLQAAYLVDLGGWYLKPQVDGTVTYLDFNGLTESGGGGAALIVGNHSDTLYAVSPALEMGSELRFGELAVLRPFIRAGVTWRDGDSLDLGASFAAAPSGVGTFTISTAYDDLLADVSAGFDVINAGGAALRLQYDGRFGNETVQNSASIKGSVPF